jgi:hypothetical protein
MPKRTTVFAGRTNPENVEASACPDIDAAVSSTKRPLTAFILLSWLLFNNAPPSI